MKKLIYLAIPIVFFAFTATASANLVTNGDFELPEVTAVQGWEIFPSGTTDLGWNVEWYGGSATYNSVNRPDPALKELHEGVNDWGAYDGDQYDELDTDWNGHTGNLEGEPASVSIYQDVQTCQGGVYELQYAWSPRPNHQDNQLKVYWNGVEVGSHSGVGGGNTNWTLETESGLAGAGATTKLEFVEVGTPDSLGMFLDGVSVVQTNECPPPPPPPPQGCDCGDVKVKNKNRAFIRNNVSTYSNTGGNTSVGGSVKNKVKGNDNENNDANGGGGNASVSTGSANSFSSVVNKVNKNFTKIKINIPNLGI